MRFLVLRVAATVSYAAGPGVATGPGQKSFKHNLNSLPSNHWARNKLFPCVYDTQIYCEAGYLAPSLQFQLSAEITDLTSRNYLEYLASWKSRANSLSQTAEIRMMLWAVCRVDCKEVFDTQPSPLVSH